jgi:hypothetical protein
MSPAERHLALFLRLQAAVLLCALPAVVMPTAWMDAIHQALGMGELPRAPIVEYLTRSLSALYVCWAIVLFLMAGDVRRYLPLVYLLGWIEAFSGVGLVVLDTVVGMPVPWILLEGPGLVVLSALTLALARRVERPPDAEKPGAP